MPGGLDPNKTTAIKDWAFFVYYIPTTTSTYFSFESTHLKNMYLEYSKSRSCGRCLHVTVIERPLKIVTHVRVYDRTTGTGKA